MVCNHLITFLMPGTVYSGRPLSLPQQAQKLVHVAIIWVPRPGHNPANHGNNGNGKNGNGKMGNGNNGNGKNGNRK